jgi:hypothetical protein
VTVADAVRNRKSACSRPEIDRRIFCACLEKSGTLAFIRIRLFLPRPKPAGSFRALHTEGQMGNGPET